METGTGKLSIYSPDILSPEIEDNPEMSVVLRSRIILNVMVRISIRVRILILTVDVSLPVTF